MLSGLQVRGWDWLRLKVGEEIGPWGGIEVWICGAILVELGIARHACACLVVSMTVDIRWKVSTRLDIASIRAPFCSFDHSKIQVFLQLQ